jgi:hypothetical protein
MITVLAAMLLGVLLGALLAYRVFYAAATATSRRALQQLQGTLDGLESAYSIKVATFEAQRELAVLSALSGDRGALTVHLPPRREEDRL